LSFVIAVLSTGGLASVALVLFILARLTEKWQAVTRKRSHYYVFYALSGVIVLLGGVHLYHIAALVSDQLPLVQGTRDLFREQTGIATSPPQLRSWLYLMFYYLPLAITMTISLLLAWRNWGWILHPDKFGLRAQRKRPRQDRHEQ
jgi:hypothetical protein